jgi:hypothetical protein
MTWHSAGTRAAILIAAVPMLMTGLYAATTVTAQASPTASAAPAVQNNCNMPGRVCIWQNINSAGEPGSFSGTNGNWAKDLPGGTQCASGSWNNCVSSIYNNKSADAVNLWETVGDTGGHICVAPMTGYSDFTQHHFSNGDALNDAVSADFVENGLNCP